MAHDGSLSLLTPDGKTATTAGGVTDLATSRTGRFLHSRLGDGTVGAFEVGAADGMVAGEASARRSSAASATRGRMTA